MINTSGLKPVEYKVLVKPDDTPRRTSAGLFLPDTVHARDILAQVKGVVVAVGGNAFEDWKGTVPEVGERVYFAKYAGMQYSNDDDEFFQLISDKDIVAVIATDCKEVK